MGQGSWKPSAGRTCAAVLSAWWAWGEMASTHAAPAVCQGPFQVRYVHRLLNPYTRLVMWACPYPCLQVGKLRHGGLVQGTWLERLELWAFIFF